MPSSTEVPNAWPFRNVTDDDIVAFQQVSRPEARKRRQLLAKQLADPAWIAQTLDALPAATLAALSLVVEAGGQRAEKVLVQLARERFGLSEADFGAAMREAIKRLLAVPLRTAWGNELILAVVEPAAALIAPLVAGLDLLALSAADFVPAESSTRSPRLFAAVCAAVRHFEIKLTAAGQIHRGSIKRLAKQVGLDETSLAVLLGTGLDVGVLRAEDDSVRLDLAMLGAAAEGRYPHYAPLGALAAQLGDFPVAQDAASRLIQRSVAAAQVSLFGESLGHLPGFVTGTVNGVAACLRRALGGTAAGHVTPSFEVFLPPESRMIDVVNIGVCCEWERLDRAFVARITKSSISSAVAAGSHAENILAGLAAASRHPIPQNVEAAIRDWAGSLVSATIASGHVIVVDPAAGARVAAALAKLAVRQLAPGVFLVDEDARIRDVTLALGRAGVHHRELPSVGRDRDATAASAPAPASPSASAPAATPAWSDATPAAARLRARVAAWRRGEPFEGVRDDFLDRARVAQPAAPAPQPAAPAAQPVAPAAVPARTPLALLERWAAQHDLRLLRDRPLLGSIASLVKAFSASELESVLDDCDNTSAMFAGLARFAVKHKRPESSPSPSGAPPGSSMASSRRRRSSSRPPALLWQHEALRERLQHASRRGDVLALQLAGGVRYVEIDRVMRRGTIWMVLGEDLANGDAVALPLDDIQALAALPDDFEIDSVMTNDDDDVDDDDVDDDDVDDDDVDDDDDDKPAVRGPWRPAPGQTAPAGHLPCPCGSGVRYRSCCRAVVTA